MKKLCISFAFIILYISPITTNESLKESSSEEKQLSQCSSERLERLLELQIAQQERQNKLLEIIALPMMQKQQRDKAHLQELQAEQDSWNKKSWWQKTGLTTLDWSEKILIFYLEKILIPDLISRAGQKINRELFKWTDDGMSRLFGEEIRLGEWLGYSSKEKRFFEKAQHYAKEKSKTQSNKDDYSALTDEEKIRLFGEKIFKNLYTQRQEFNQQFPQQKPSHQLSRIYSQHPSESEVD